MHWTVEGMTPLVIMQSPDGSAYQVVVPAYANVGTRKSQIFLRVMAWEYLEEHVDWEALLNDPEHGRLSDFEEASDLSMYIYWRLGSPPGNIIIMQR